MTTEVYASQNGTDYFRLDLLKDESILMKYTYKDTQDLSKIYSPYSQSFTLQGSLNNQKILGYLGETKILKSKSNNVFDCKIYNNGLLAKKGLLKVTEVRYEDGKVKTFTANFTTGMLSLKDRFGEDKISDLGSALIQWDNLSVNNYLKEGVMSSTGFNFILPFSSNSRVWQVADINNATALDNIAFNQNADRNGDNFIKINELTPAISFAHIMGLIKSKYDLDVIMPIENEDYYNDLYVSCNKTVGSFNNSVYYDVINAPSFVRFNISVPESFAYKPFTTGWYPTIPKYIMSTNAFTDVFEIYLHPTPTPLMVYSNINYFQPRYEGPFSYIQIGFINVFNTKTSENIEMSVSIELLNGVIFKSVTNNVVNGQSSTYFTFRVDDSDFSSRYFRFKIKVYSSVPIIWSYSIAQIFYNINTAYLNKDQYSQFLANYGYTATHNNSATMNMSSIDLLKSVPDIKITDFLTSFFKTFNLSVFETSPEDGRLYWLNPKDIKSENKEYSGTEIDYTDYVVSDKVNKQIANDYNYYNFKHKTPKYKSNADYLFSRGYEYGQLTYPTIKPTRDLNEYKIETNFSIIQNVDVSGLGDAKTFYGFTNETPTRQLNNALRYKPNTEDFTLFFYNGQVAPRTPYLGYLNVYPNGTKVIEPLNAVTIVGAVHNLSGFSLGFGLIENAIQESLYENFYKEQTERLLEPNTLQHSYSLQLPPIELVLNYANTKQGQSNIPSGFRLQNDIIIQDVRYSIIDATIDQTTGKTTLNLLNYV